MGPSNTTGRFATDLKIFRISQTKCHFQGLRSMQFYEGEPRLFQTYFGPNFMSRIYM